MFVEGIHHQRAFARTGNPRNAGEHAQGDAAVDVLQVVGGNAVEQQRALALAALVGQGDAGVAAQVAGRERVRPQELVHRALEHDFAALRAGAGAQLNNCVRRADGGLVVLHHQHGVAAGLQRTQGAQQAFVVAGVQANGGFVQHIGDAHQAGAQL